jgi:hypothetical protein
MSKFSMLLFLLSSGDTKLPWHEGPFKACFDYDRNLALSLLPENLDGLDECEYEEGEWGLYEGHPITKKAKFIVEWGWGEQLKTSTIAFGLYSAKAGSSYDNIRLGTMDIHKMFPQVYPIEQQAVVRDFRDSDQQQCDICEEAIGDLAAQHVRCGTLMHEGCLESRCWKDLHGKDLSAEPARCPRCGDYITAPWDP